MIGHNTNIIKESTFTLEGTNYKVEDNDGEYNLHSSSDGYNRR